MPEQPLSTLDAAGPTATSDSMGLRDRGRDLYGLRVLSQQEPIAAEIRQRTPELWEPAATGLGRTAAPVRIAAMPTAQPSDPEPLFAW